MSQSYPFNIEQTWRNDDDDDNDNDDYNKDRMEEVEGTHNVKSI